MTSPANTTRSRFPHGSTTIRKAASAANGVSEPIFPDIAHHEYSLQVVALVFFPELAVYHCLWLFPVINAV
jgi:hypothetical protein